MPYVAPGLIAVVTSPIAYTETDADGKPVGDTIVYQKGDVIHDEAFVKTLHDKHFHHALSVTAHHEHLCPADCAKVAKAPARFVPPPPPPQSLPAAPAALQNAEVK